MEEKMSKAVKNIDKLLEAFNPRMMGNKPMKPKDQDWGKLDYKENVKQMAMHKYGLQQALSASADAIFALINQVGDLGHAAHAVKMQKHMEQIAKIANDVIKKYG